MKRYISLLITVIMVTALTACSSLLEKGEQARKDEEYIAAQQAARAADPENSGSSSSISFDGTRESAWLLLSDWLEEHKSDLDASEIIREDMGIDEIDGKEYFNFGILYSSEQPNYDMFMVERGSGELFYYDPYAEEMYPLDEWYQSLVGSDSSAALPTPPATDNGELPSITAPELVGGRWRTDNGMMIEFLPDGNINYSNIEIFTKLESGVPFHTRTLVTNGSVSLFATQVINLQYKLETFDTSKSEITQVGPGQAIIGNQGEVDIFSYNGATFQRPYGSNFPSGTLIGEWVPMSDTMLYYIFNEDGTGEYGNDSVRKNFGSGNGQSFEWYIDGSTLTVTIRDEAYFDYNVQGDILTIYTSNSSIYFTRVGGN